MLKVNDLSVSYGEKQPLILQNLSFDLKKVTRADSAQKTLA